MQQLPVRLAPVWPVEKMQFWVLGQQLQQLLLYHAQNQQFEELPQQPPRQPRQQLLRYQPSSDPLIVLASHQRLHSLVALVMVYPHHENSAPAEQVRVAGSADQNLRFFPFILFILYHISCTSRHHVIPPLSY